jgi:putative transposase
MYYHVYNRGAHKAIMFHDESDYDRMMKMLYSNNDSSSRQFSHRKIEEMYSHSRTKLVKIHAYVIMPNHFHLLVEELTSKGMSKFIHKTLTGYAMYFNKKYKHSGTIIQGIYKAKSVEDENYYLELIKYIHSNPQSIILKYPELFSDSCKSDPDFARKYCMNYKYSSQLDFLGIVRPENNILG